MPETRAIHWKLDSPFVNSRVLGSIQFQSFFSIKRLVTMETDTSLAGEVITFGWSGISVALVAFMARGP